MAGMPPEHSGALGGMSKSPQKTKASRLNGTKGGRPPKCKVCNVWMKGIKVPHSKSRWVKCPQCKASIIVQPASM